MKPSYKTLEGWLSALAAIISAFMATGLFAQHWAVQIVGVVGTVLTALGYGKQRSDLKASYESSRPVTAAPNEAESIRTALQ